MGPAGRGGIFNPTMAAESLSSLLVPKQIALGLEGESRTDILRALTGILPLPERVRGEALKAVLRREEIQTTGIGQGIAIPHGKVSMEPPILAALGITKSPVQFGSVDGLPVRIFVLVVSRPDVTGPHVQALAGISRLLGHRSFREALLTAKDAGEVMALIAGEPGS
jgi:mannitol/fructose-specific phosphotransferase system IIA component (Ntr-type)